MKLSAFRAVRPRPDLAGEVVCLPYDVMSTEEAREMARGKPSSFLHVIRSEIDLPPETDAHTDAVYNLAKQNLETMLAEGRMLQETAPALYVYRLVKDGRNQTGIAALNHIDDYLSDHIKKHELTRPDKEEDRLHHIDTTGANCEPVFLAFKSSEQPEIAKILNQVADSQKPLYDVTAEDGVRHILYSIEPGELQNRLTAKYQALTAVYIADGHHRSASTVRVGKKRREANGPGSHEWFLAVTFPDVDLRIMPYNRIVKDLNGLSVDGFLARVKESFDVSEGKGQSALHTIFMLLGDKWYTLKAKSESHQGADAIGRLDVSILQDRLLAPILGIQDPRTSERIAFVGGIRGEGELVKLVSSGAWKVAFSMYPTSMQELFDIADAGQIMPPKSTWFEPKLRSGFLVHKF
ncbi:MAG: DUF1015 family protein [Spirochaetia bacterium]|nr:DUF1015 family protein [Spirochaetia bacterium]